jgi:hypothetical protein
LVRRIVSFIKTGATIRAQVYACKGRLFCKKDVTFFKTLNTTTMKKILSIAAAAIILISTISSCKKSDDSISSQVTQLTQTVQQGKWKITYYNDNGTVETSTYSGYEFVFNSNGTVIATKGAITVSGTWTNGIDDSTLKLYLDFGAANPFQELNDDWHVTGQSSTVITLEDVSGGGSPTDYLTFEKI